MDSFRQKNAFGYVRFSQTHPVTPPSRSLLCGCFKPQPAIRSATDILDVNVVVAHDGSSRRRRLLCATQNDVASKRDVTRKFEHADLTTHV
jgi:hypothetical protein